MPWPRLWACRHPCGTSQARTLLKSLALGSVVVMMMTLPLVAYRSRRRTKRSVVNGGGGKAEMDAIESIATDIVIAAEVAAVRDIGIGGLATGIMRRNRGLDGTGEGRGAGAGAQAGTEIGTGDTDVQRGQHVAGAAVVTIGDAVEAGMESGVKKNTVAGLQREGGALALGIDGGAETVWTELAMS